MYRALLVLLGVLAACDGHLGDVGVQPDPVLSLSADTAWAGSRISVSSPSFVAEDTLPVIAVGGDTLVLEKTGATTVLALLPDSQGDLTLDVRLKHGGHTAVQVRTFGFAVAHPGPELGSGTPQPWSDNGEPTALILSSQQLGLHNYRTSATQLLGSDSGWSPCQGYIRVTPSLANDGVVALQKGCGKPVVTAVARAGTVLVDSGPSFTGWLLIHARQGRWLLNRDTDGFLLYSRNAGGTFDITTLAPSGSVAEGVLTHAGGSRTIPVGYYSLSGIPVFDSTSVAYTIAAQHVGGAAFVGDTLFALISGEVPGSQQDSAPVLVALDAQTGAERARTSATSGRLGMAADPAGRWLYLGGGVGSGRIGIQVFDRTTLARVATLRVPASLSAGPGIIFVILVDGARRRLYLTRNYGAHPTHVFEFDLLP